MSALIRAGGERFRGIRHGVSWDADPSIVSPASPVRPGLLADKTFREGFAVLSRPGLSYDVSLYHPQINDVADLAGAFPDATMVLNHVGGLLGIGAYRGKRDEVFSRWAASIKVLAARPNVYVKVGGLGQGYNGFGFNEQAEPPSSEVLAATFRPYVETCIEAFGGCHARCLRVTFLSTKSHTVIRSSGMPASCWQRVPAAPKKPICSPVPRRGVIAST